MAEANQTNGIQEVEEARAEPVGTTLFDPARTTLFDPTQEFTARLKKVGSYDVSLIDIIPGTLDVRKLEEVDVYMMALLKILEGLSNRRDATMKMLRNEPLPPAQQRKSVYEPELSSIGDFTYALKLTGLDNVWIRVNSLLRSINKMAVRVDGRAIYPARDAGSEEEDAERTQAAWLTAQKNLHGFTMGKTENYSDFVIEMGRLKHLHAQREKHTKEPEEAENSRELVNLFLNAIQEPGLKEEVWSLMKMDRDPKLTKLLDYIAHARKHRSKADLLVKTYKCPTHPNANSHDFKDCWNNRRGVVTLHGSPGGPMMTTGVPAGFKTPANSLNAKATQMRHRNMNVQEKRIFKQVVDDKKLFNCPYHLCNRTFASKYGVRYHMKTFHEGKQPFQCNICDAKFTTKHGMTGHVAAIHEGKKPFKCNICNTEFASKWCYETHARIRHQ